MAPAPDGEVPMSPRIFDPKVPRPPGTKARRRRPLTTLTLHVVRSHEDGGMVRIPMYQRPVTPATERRSS
jgi:hypothetical protein